MINIKEQLYLQALTNVLETADKTQSYTKENVKKVVVYGIKFINAHHVNVTTVEDADIFYKLVLGICDFIGLLTPNEFMNMFPIAKEFNGHKYECKDYFGTWDYLNTLERDKPIKDQNIDNGSIVGFLWEYHNWEVRRFTVKLTTALERIQAAQGLPTMFETLGIETHAVYENNGKQFMVNANGRTQRLRKKMPRFLKLVK